MDSFPASFQQAALMDLAKAHTRVRGAFIDAGLVTPDQWDRAAAKGGPLEDVLSALEAVPAAWADDPAVTAVTAYHKKMVAHLAREGSFNDLPRRLRWGRFLILSELGRGGMGVVFLAWDTGERKLVALKRVRGAARQVLSRFRREGRLLARLEHSGIARFLGTEQVGGAEILVMEYVPGVTASRVVRRLTQKGQVLPWETAIGWAAQTLAALAHAHEQRIVHRDIKPGNLMVTASGRAIKLLDMGLAKCLDEPAGDTLTQDGQALGTREYMPPEQWQGQTDITPAADLYALGCTLFCLLAGRPPYEGETSYRQMTQHLSAAIPSVRAHRLDVPAAVDQVIQRMMAKKPAHRGTAREINWLLSRAAAVRKTVAAPVAAGGSAANDRLSDADTGPNPSLSAAGAGDTAHALRGAQTTLTGSGVWELTVELAAEARRLVRGWLQPDRARDSVVVVDPARRLREVGRELGRAYWDGLRGRRREAVRPAWLTLGGIVLVLSALIWLC